MKRPKWNDKAYRKILDRGCGLTYDEYNGDYDCLHQYPWDCEECPFVLERQKIEMAALAGGLDIQGQLSEMREV